MPHGRRAPDTRKPPNRKGSGAPAGWRWRWDLNPRWSYPHTRFRGVLLRPLGHATAGQITRRSTPGPKCRLAPALVEELQQQRRALLLADARHDLDPVQRPAVPRQVPHRPTSARLGVGRPRTPRGPAAPAPPHRHTSRTARGSPRGCSRSAARTRGPDRPRAGPPPRRGPWGRARPPARWRPGRRPGRPGRPRRRRRERPRGHRRRVPAPAPPPSPRHTRSPPSRAGIRWPCSPAQSGSRFAACASTLPTTR